MRHRFTNARLVDATGERFGELVIEDGRISGDLHSPCTTSEDLHGLVLMPAFTDTHCHLRDPGYPEKETMETGMRAALKGGFVTLCAMANTDPVCATPALVEKNHEKARTLQLCRLMQAGAAGVDLGDEIPTDYAALSRVTRVISNDGKTIFSDAFMKNLLCASEQYGFLVSTHCQPERATVRRDLALLKETGGHLHVGHISCRETVEQIRAAKREGLPVTCEAMPHHLFTWDDPYRVNPPIRSREDVLALIEGIRDGTVTCLSTDHAPHTEADKAAGAAGISNIEHAAAIFFTVLSEAGIPLCRMSELMSRNPARLLNTGSGLLNPGAAADLVLFDPEARWTIHREDMISKSHNTPFVGRAVKGRVLRTILQGETKYDYRQTVS